MDVCLCVCECACTNGINYGKTNGKNPWSWKNCGKFEKCGKMTNLHQSMEEKVDWVTKIHEKCKSRHEASVWWSTKFNKWRTFSLVLSIKIYTEITCYFFSIGVLNFISGSSFSHFSRRNDKKMNLLPFFFHSIRNWIISFSDPINRAPSITGQMTWIDANLILYVKSTHHQCQPVTLEWSKRVNAKQGKNIIWWYLHAFASNLVMLASMPNGCHMVAEIDGMEMKSA